MLTEAENQRLSSVGPGTPAGELLRRYWQPIAALVDLEEKWVMPVRILGEDLVLFRTELGELGLVQSRCPHRSVSLEYGITDDLGIRCAYHGWYFSPEGKCLEQPYDDVNGPGTFKDRIAIAAYPVKALGGLVWAYFGPLPAPELPKWDILVENGLAREIGVTHLDCNWLQCMENSLDPVHFEWLHAQQVNFLARKRGEPPVMTPRRHLKIEFDVFEFGVFKRRLLEGDSETSDDWTVGHPILFPNTLAVGKTFQLRVPIDDTNTLHINYATRPLADGEAPQSEVPRVDVAQYNPDGTRVLETILGQDMMAWSTQGPVAPRTLENLAKSDRGVLLFRKLLSENIEKVERGEDPMGLIRDPARNEPMLPIARERHHLQAMGYNSRGVTAQLISAETPA